MIQYHCIRWNRIKPHFWRYDASIQDAGNYCFIIRISTQCALHITHPTDNISSDTLVLIVE